jgi:signal peptidase I
VTLLWSLSFAYVWALAADRLWVQPSRRLAAARAGRRYAPGTWSLALRIAWPVLIGVALLRTFVVDAYVVPTASMEPALPKDSVIGVNRLAYGLRMPLTGEVILAPQAPAAGEVVAFRYPREPKTVFVKRVYGAPGDRVQVVGHSIAINGQRLTAPWTPGTVRQNVTVGAADVTLLIDAATPRERPPVDLVVPPGHYFVLGDNLDHSADSREWGVLSATQLIGRVIS